MSRLTLAMVLLIATILFFTGLTWGLPSSRVNAYLFVDRPAWTGEQILKLAGGWDTDTAVAADRDRNPLEKSDQPLLLNGTDQQRAEIVRRYRLFSYQPDEMITFRALSQIKPGEGKFDPKLYQYGGLWMYPVGGLLKVASVVGYVDLRSDLAFYLDHPEAFARFYIVARVYSALWGLLGVVAVWLIVRKLTTDEWLAAAAGLCFAAMPVVITMAHEAKPHLGGAVLMLWAAWAAMRFLDSPTWRAATLVGVFCGAAVAMVPSSLPVFLLLPVLAGMRRKAIGSLALAAVAGVLCYAITNPYVVIHLAGDRTMLESSAGNTAAMYALRDLPGGLWNVCRLTVEASGWLIAVGGVVAWLGLHFSPPDRRQKLIVLAAPAMATFVLFAAFGAGKPGEYGRFLIVPGVTLLIGVFVLLQKATAVPARRGLTVLVVAITAVFGWVYLRGFVADARGYGSREIAATLLGHARTTRVAVYAEPAPYCQPPLDLFGCEWWLLPAGQKDAASVAIRVRDVGSRISWANKPLSIDP